MFTYNFSATAECSKSSGCVRVSAAVPLCPWAALLKRRGFLNRHKTKSTKTGAQRTDHGEKDPRKTLNKADGIAESRNDALLRRGDSTEAAMSSRPSVLAIASLTISIMVNGPSNQRVRSSSG